MIHSQYMAGVNEAPHGRSQERLLGLRHEVGVIAGENIVGVDCFLERCFLEWMSRAIDRLPPCAKVSFYVLTILERALDPRPRFLAFSAEVIFSP